MAIGSEIRFDAPDNACFGCGKHNPQGLHLSFTHVSHSGVAGRFVAPAFMNGAPGVVHGGLQATLLDEAIGFAMHAHQESTGELEQDQEGWRKVVTVEFDLRYRKPVPTGVEIGLRAEIVHAAGRDYLAVAEIVNAEGDVLTAATARWRKLRD